MGVIGIISARSSCGLSADEDITINVKNYGYLPLKPMFR